jgi:hypothetical protein
VQECFNSNTIHHTRNIQNNGFFPNYQKKNNGFPNQLTKKIFKHNKIRKQIPLEGAGDSSGDLEFQDPHLVGYALRNVKNKGLTIPPKPMKKKGVKRRDIRAISSVQSSCR